LIGASGIGAVRSGTGLELACLRLVFEVRLTVDRGGTLLRCSEAAIRQREAVMDLHQAGREGRARRDLPDPGRRLADGRARARARLSLGVVRRDWAGQFHWRTILLPPRAIDYVIVHELVHLIEPHHGAEFWRRVERALPDYELRKRWLAENGENATRV
jgi:predicted metal-dependent hydrolase